MISLFTPPSRTDFAAAAAMSAVAVALVIFLPSSFFEKAVIDRESKMLIFVASIFAGSWSAVTFSKKGIVKSDPFYVRSWWGFWSFLCAAVAAIFLRHIAFDSAISLFLMSFGTIIGNKIYRIIRPYS